MARRPLLTAFKQDGTTYVFPDTSSYIATSADAVDQGRNAEVRVIGDIVREDITKIEVEWKVLSPEDYSDICKLFKSNHGGKFFIDIEYFDMTENDWRRKTFYPNDRKASIYSTAAILKENRLDDGRPAFYTNVSLHLIEQ